MKKIIIVAIIIGVALLVVLPQLHPPHEQYVAGRIRIPVRGISAEVYIRQPEPMDGMSSLWNGGKVTTKADLSNVQVGDMADIYTVEGEHLVLECISIRKGLGWLVQPEGDVVVINGRWLYRFTRL